MGGRREKGGKGRGNGEEMKKMGEVMKIEGEEGNLGEKVKEKSEREEMWGKLRGRGRGKWGKMEKNGGEGGKM